MSKICKKCDVLETNDNNDYCGICANELVADLEAKLAEKEKRIELADCIIKQYADKDKNLYLKFAEKEEQIENLRENSLSKKIFKEKLIPSHCMEQYEKYEQQIDKLKQHLAEKNKQLRAKIGNMKSTDFIKMCISCGFLVDAKVVDNQDKISFAVEQLEKVKEKTKIFFVKATHKHNEHYSAQYNMITDFDLCFAIDNQIEELKKEMK